ncbi:MAG: hypothetical protein ACD_22C00092G0020, partial [uncultured bacterium]
MKLIRRVGVFILISLLFSQAVLAETNAPSEVATF